MTDVHVTLKLAKSSNNYDYTDLKDYDEIQPQQSDAIGAKYTFGVPPIAKAGDTITIRWSKNLNTYGFGNEKFNSNIMTADGKNILAEPAANNSMTDNQFIFTLTDYVKDHNNIKGELLVPLFVDPKEVKNDSLKTPISASLGNTSDKHYIVVHYNEYAHSYPSSVGSIITEDASNKEVSSVIYANPEGDMADGGHVDVENIDGSNIKLDQNSLRSFKVYRVSPSIELPQSYDFDPHDFDTDDNVEDVTSLAKYSFSKNVDNEPVMSINLPASVYASSKSKYVIEFTTKYESSDSKILGLRSKYWDGIFGTLTSSEFAIMEYNPESDVSGDNKPVEKFGDTIVQVIDDTDNKVLDHYTYNSEKQKVGTNINYNKSSVEKELVGSGYKITTSPVIPTTIEEGSHTYTIHVVHDVVPVNNTDHPHDPNTPINPNDPNGPKWPDKDEYTKSYTYHVEYRLDSADGKVAHTPSTEQTSVWNRTVYVDKVTGEIVESRSTTWMPDKANYNSVVVPDIAGYTNEAKTVNGTDISKGQVASIPTKQENIVDVVIYTKNGEVTRHITYSGIDEKGKIPTSPKDDTVITHTKGDKTTVDGSFPEVPNPVVPGYHTDEPSVPASTPGKNGVPTSGTYNVDVPYTKNGKIVPIYPDGNPIPNAPTPTYKTDPKDPTKVVPDEPTPTIPGYSTHTKTVTPKNPGKDTPVVYTKDKTPEPQTSTTTETESASQTVHYTGAGDKTPGDHKISKDNVFSREVTKDSTGKVVKSGEWTPDSHDFAGVKTPLVEGYHADKAVATTDAATPAKPDVETTVAYTKNGKIVPVDPDGNPIPNAPTPTYKTDPKDPTKVVPDEPTPTIPGYSTHTKTVTPKNPGEDTPVVYTKDKTPSTDGGTTHTPKPEENTSVKPKSSMIPTPKPEENTSVKPKSSIIPTPKPEENTSVKPKSSIIPTPEEDNDGTNSSVNKTAKNVKTATTTAAIKKQDNQAQLPQTGSHKSTLALAAGSVLVLFGGLLVVLGLRKRRD